MSRKVVTKPTCGSALALCGLQLRAALSPPPLSRAPALVHPLLAPVSTADRPLVVRLFEDGAPAAAASQFHPASRICSPACPTCCSPGPGRRRGAPLRSRDQERSPATASPSR